MKAASFQYQGKTITIVSDSPTSSTVYIDNVRKNINNTNIKELKTFTKSLVEGNNGIIFNISNKFCNGISHKVY